MFWMTVRIFFSLLSFWGGCLVLLNFFLADCEAGYTKTHQMENKPIDFIFPDGIRSRSSPDLISLWYFAHVPWITIEWDDHMDRHFKRCPVRFNSYFGIKKFGCLYWWFFQSLWNFLIVRSFLLTWWLWGSIQGRLSFFPVLRSTCRIFRQFQASLFFFLAFDNEIRPFSRKNTRLSRLSFRNQAW